MSKLGFLSKGSAQAESEGREPQWEMDIRKSVHMNKRSYKML